MVRTSESFVSALTTDIDCQMEAELLLFFCSLDFINDFNMHQLTVHFSRFDPVPVLFRLVVSRRGTGGTSLALIARVFVFTARLKFMT